jgi:hypothetical protein
MAAETPLADLVEEERRARFRLALYRAKVYGGRGSSPMVVDQRLSELERRWQGSAQRLRRARGG